MHGRGVCVAGGMHGGGVYGRGVCTAGACVAGGCAWWGERVWQVGHVWQEGVRGGDVHGRGRACMVIRSISGRYASYWNAFLFSYTLKP